MNLRNKKHIADGIDFLRDVVAFMCVVAGIIAVAFDGKVSFLYQCKSLSRFLLNIHMQVHLIEACLFPVFYIIYIALVISMSYFRVRDYL